MTAPAVRTSFEALGFDPAPGDLDQVEELAGRYRRVSARLGEALDALNSIAEQTGVWQGAAADAFAERIDELPEYLDKAAESTAAAGQALAEWAAALTGLQRQAYDLELRARQARALAEAARDDPAFDLAGVTYYDEESLRAAQRLIDAAIARLTEAMDGLNAVFEAARRLLDQHGEIAEGIAELLDHARDLAPDKPGGLGHMLGGAFDAVTGALDDALDAGMDVLDGVHGFLEDHAELIAVASEVLGHVSTVVGLAADLEIPGVSQALGAVAIGLDGAALKGLVVARSLGADVSDQDIALAGIGVAADLVGLIPGVQGTLVETVAETVAVGTDVVEYGPYFVPRDDRQWGQLAASVLFPGLRDALFVENLATDTISDVRTAVEGEDG